MSRIRGMRGGGDDDTVEALGALQAFDEQLQGRFAEDRQHDLSRQAAGIHPRLDRGDCFHFKAVRVWFWNVYAPFFSRRNQVMSSAGKLASP